MYNYIKNVKIDKDKIIGCDKCITTNLDACECYNNLWKQLIFYKYYNFLKKFKLNIYAPIVCYINLQKFENDYTTRFMSEAKFVNLIKMNKVTIKIFFDEIHPLHFIHYKDMLDHIKTIEKHKLVTP